MKIIHKIGLPLLLLSLFFSGCEDALDIKSESRVDPMNHNYNTADDNVYAISTVLAKLQNIGERYALLGELRGDLMDITPDANYYLQQIYNFEVTADNPYADIRDYYVIINNCNYIINHIDTTVVSEGERIMKTGYSAVMAYRAWTYMQIALNYGHAYWFEKPLLDVSDFKNLADFPQYTIEELANKLIPGLEPLVNVKYQINFARYLYFPVNYLLGELYLWTGQYEMAATKYCNLMNGNGFDSNGNLIPITFLNKFRWSVLNGEIANFDNTNSIFDTQYNFVSAIGASSEFAEATHLSDYSLYSDNGGKYWIKPSSVAINNWDSAMYYDKDLAGRNYGDLRGQILNYAYAGTGDVLNFNQHYIYNRGQSSPNYKNFITKYFYRYLFNSDISTELIGVVSPGLVYLRYAEAVNRLGKPNLAFAVLKYGLNSANIINYVPASEKPNPLPQYMDFSNSSFAKNVGIHGHGCGATDTDPRYKIPEEFVDTTAYPIKTIDYVEDLIVKELALETAFDGNRFHDLMRVAIRRDDNSYLADKVAKKHVGNEGAIMTLLMDRKNWYLPEN